MFEPYWGRELCQEIKILFVIIEEQLSAKIQQNEERINDLQSVIIKTKEDLEKSKQALQKDIAKVSKVLGIVEKKKKHNWNWNTCID